MKPLLILPVENQVRELDAKLLVAVVAAQAGYRSVIGWKGKIDLRIGRFPPSVYFAKSISVANTKMLRIKRKLGHYVIAWDEEAVVHYPKDIYYARRVGKEALALVDLLVAWGEDNRDLLLGHPSCEESMVRVLGNPRADLLRPEMRELFQDRVDELRAAHGDFILVNTNFGSVNGYTDILNLMRREVPDGPWVPGRGALGMPREYAQGLFDYRSEVFRGFQEVLPALSDAFPDRKIVLRPHPSEDHAFWRRCLAGRGNVEVIAEGNVVPWLIACACLVHNGCTTAVEGFLLGTPIVSFVPREDDRYEFELPNRLGARCRDAAAIAAAIRAGGDADLSGERAALVARYIHDGNGELAARRLLTVIPERRPRADLARLPRRLLGRVHAEVRAVSKRVKRWRGQARYSDDFMRQRFPRLDVATVQEKADRMARITGAAGARVRPVEDDVFEVRPG